MNLEKLKYRNWFKREKNVAGKGSQISIDRDQAKILPMVRAGSRMSLQRVRDRWIDNVFSSYGVPSLASDLHSGGLPWPQAPEFYCPQIDVSGDDDGYHIGLDLPGLSESAIALELKCDVLTFKGKEEQRSEEKEKHYYGVERSYGSFRRTLALPEDAIAESIDAKLNKGVLKVDVPRRKTESRHTKHISISL